MTITEKRIEGLQNKVIKLVQAPPRKVPENLPTLHFLNLICGMRGSGKTNTMVGLVQKYDKTKSFDFIYIWSPTCRREPKYQHLIDTLKYSKVDLREDFTIDDFVQVRSDIELRIEKYKKYERDVKIWKRFCQYKGKWEDFDNDELLTVFDEFNYQKPETEFKNGCPTTLLIFDDLQNNKDLFGTLGKAARIMNNFTVTHRHFLTSIIWSCQAFKGGGVPKSIRQNISWLILFSNKSPEIRKEIAKEVCAIVSPDEFIECWTHATRQSRHDYLYLDLEAPDGFQIRKNLDILLTLKNSTEKENNVDK